jgi:multiple sugar transport system permease protein
MAERAKRTTPWYERHLPYLLLAPTVLLLLALTFFPFFYAISLTFLDTKGPKWKFIGGQNYGRLLSDLRKSDSLLRNAIGNTAVFTVCAVAAEFLLGLGLALFFNTHLWGKGIFRSLLLIPMMLPPIVIAILFKLLYQPNFGVLNWLLGLVGLPGLLWEASVSTALLSLILIDIWEWTPFMFLILLAGLQAIPVDPYEAAAVDGASRWQIFRHITFPLLKPAVLIALLLRIMDALRLFDQAFILTGGGPANATETLSLYIYKVAFRFSDLGYAAVVSFVLLVITTLVSQLFIRYLKTEEIF